MRVLAIVHEAAQTGGGGIFERAVPERGHRLDRWVAADGETPPGAPTDWGAVMVFGGAMHPDQDAEHPWLAGEAGFLEEALAEGVPLLGVCLGAQLIARAAGTPVRPASQAEVGWYEVSRDDAHDDPVLDALPDRFRAFQWHYYTFDLPAGAVQLASSAAARQAYRLGDRVWGIQFDAEVDRTMLDHGCARAARSCRSRLRSFARRRTATCPGGTSRAAPSAMRSSTRPSASARSRGVVGAGLGRELRVARPLVPRAFVVPCAVSRGAEELDRDGGAAA